MALISNKDRPKQNVVYSSALRPAGKATASWHGIPITGEQDSTKLPTCRHRARKLRPLRVHCRPVQVHFPPPQYIHFLFLFVGPLVFPCTAPRSILSFLPHPSRNLRIPNTERPSQDENSCQSIQEQYIARQHKRKAECR